MLPQEFTMRMENWLGQEEMAAFLKSYERKRAQALRVNTQKISLGEFLRIAPFSLRPVPWAGAGFYYGEEERPGRHPYHEAGLYYMQEPSAMAVAALAEARPGERVLDLCAAPGGKTTQLGVAMEGKGLLVANEIHPARAKILAQNVERMGISHGLVLNEDPEALAERFPEFFDRIVVDAPCSGEGMFRKEEQALLQWSVGEINLCAQRQVKILDQAARMLRPGGRLLYSTCTFAPEENEGSVTSFLNRHPEFRVEQVSAYEGFAPGQPQWVCGAKEVEHTFRLWPHRLEGEGHYVAVLEKYGSSVRPSGEQNLLGRRKDCSLTARQNTLGGQVKRGDSRRTSSRGKAAGRQAEQEAYRVYQAFARENLRQTPQGEPVLFGEQLYLMPCALELSGLRVLRAGLHVGTVSKGRFTPAHALALHLKAQDALRCCLLEADSCEVEAYLRGEALPWEGEKGWCLVLVDGYSLGWGKAGGGLLKNHYPKGLRRQT